MQIFCLRNLVSLFILGGIGSGMVMGSDGIKGVSNSVDFMEESDMPDGEIILEEDEMMVPLPQQPSDKNSAGPSVTPAQEIGVLPKHDLIPVNGREEKPNPIDPTQEGDRKGGRHKGERFLHIPIIKMGEPVEGEGGFKVIKAWGQ